MAATLDDALRRLSASGPECVTGSSNHAPMVIEALLHAGRGDAVIAWLERYAAVLAPAPEPPLLDVSPILGDAGSYAAYAGQLRRELQELSWTDVACWWIEQLAPGLSGAAGHGWIRTGHALRALTAAATPERLDELARALAYWAAEYRELPGHLAPRGARSPEQVLASIDDSARVAEGGSISAALEGLARHRATFEASVNALAPEYLDRRAMVRAASSAILRGGFSRPIVFTHALTAAWAMNPILDVVGSKWEPALAAYVWQFIVSLVALYAPDGPARDVSPDEGGLVDRAIATGYEHAIMAAVAAMDAHRTFGGDVLAAGAALVEEIGRSVRPTSDMPAPQPITYAIRLARPDEVPRLRHIEDEAGTMFSGLGLVDEARDVSFPLDDLARLVRLGQVWVACTEGAIPVGMVIASVREGAVHVEELDVLPAHGRRGLGARLLAAACAWGRDHGHAAVTLSTFRDVPWNGPFYRKHGFRELRPEEWTSGIREIRDREARHGLRVDARVFMLRELR
ncbi:MAG: GNAT family N-acetyltransferase [Anaeromyxobacteraceae bacterium]